VGKESKSDNRIEKYPRGAEAHKDLLEKEGFNVLPRGKRYSVENYVDYLYQSE
jgi:hypothetical protein